MIKVGDTFIHIGKVSGRPEIATVISGADDYLIGMEGVNKQGNKVKFVEHLANFNKRWAKQLSLFEVENKSKLSKKYLR